METVIKVNFQNPTDFLFISRRNLGQFCDLKIRLFNLSV